jgi:hypothetical protein
MCIKIGGYMRFEAAYGVNGSSTRVQGDDLNNRWTNDLWYRVRGYITADARDQTADGARLSRGWWFKATQPLIRRRPSTRTAPSFSGRKCRALHHAEPLEQQLVDTEGL